MPSRDSSNLHCLKKRKMFTLVYLARIFLTPKSQLLFPLILIFFPVELSNKIVVPGIYIQKLSQLRVVNFNFAKVIDISNKLSLSFTLVNHILSTRTLISHSKKSRPLFHDSTTENFLGSSVCITSRPSRFQPTNFMTTEYSNINWGCQLINCYETSGISCEKS